MTREEKKAKLLKYKTRKQRFIRITTQFFVWLGVAVIYYIGFSVFFDTPVEYELKHSTDMMREEYDRLSARYDSLSLVLDNVIERDRNVFRILFEADPYDFEEENAANRWNFYEQLLSQSTIELQKQFARHLSETERSITQLQQSYDRMVEAIDSCSYRNVIPAIQPVINKQLTGWMTGWMAGITLR